MTFGQALAAMSSALSAPNLERTGVTYEVKVGDENVDANSAPPRILIIPLHSRGLRNPSNQAAIPAARTPRNLYGELHVFRAELWAKGPNSDTTTIGKDYVACSTMKATFAATMRATFGTTFALMDGHWSSTEGESMEQDGRKFVQEFSIDLLTVDAVWDNVEVLETDTNTGYSDPGEDWVDPAS